jgi:hypothetical protein
MKSIWPHYFLVSQVTSHPSPNHIESVFLAFEFRIAGCLLPVACQLPAGKQNQQKVGAKPKIGERRGKWKQQIVELILRQLLS